MDFYTAVLRQSGQYWVALCLKNGIVDQENTQDGAIAKLKKAIESFEQVREAEPDVYCAPVSINEPHEFLTIGTKEVTTESYEFRAVHA